MDDDALIGLGLTLVGAALIIAGLIIAAAIWFIISVIVAYIRYRQYLAEAEEDYDAIAQELGIDLPIDEVLGAIGVEMPAVGGYDNIADWMAGIPVGVTGEE